MSAPHTTRRTVIAAAGAAGIAATLAACGESGDSGSGDGYGGQNPPTGENGDGGSTGDPGAETGGQPGGGTELAQTSEIPAGQGKVFRDEKVVVTQPTSGDFKAYSAVCTHSGCLVAEVSEGSINCTCHGSKFNIADGSVTGGPAQQPLPPAKITVEGTSIRLG